MKDRHDGRRSPADGKPDHARHPQPPQTRPVRRQYVERHGAHHRPGTMAGRMGRQRSRRATCRRGRHRLPAADRPLERLWRQRRPAGISHETITWPAACSPRPGASTSSRPCTPRSSTPSSPPSSSSPPTTSARAGSASTSSSAGTKPSSRCSASIHRPTHDTPTRANGFDCVKQLWQSDEPFDYTGDFLTLRGLKGKPHPYGGSRPMVLNAGMSDIGKAFAIESCDGLFSTPPLRRIRGIRHADRRRQSRTAGRGVPYPVFTSATVICRPRSLRPKISINTARTTPIGTPWTA